MKFKIRFADQIVGFFIILALVSLAFVIIMLGRSQRWFARDTSFNTDFVSATGLSKNMPVLYRGFTIGNVKDFKLTDWDRVEVIFFIYEEYRDRVKYGSMVELLISPVGLGNQFLFHGGKGDELLEDGAFIPNIDSQMGRNFIRQGLADDPYHDDSISLLLNRASSLLDGLNHIVAEVEEALRTGTDETAIGQIIGGLNRTMAGVETLPNTVNEAVDGLVTDINDVVLMLDGLLVNVNPILEDLGVLSAQLADPEGTIAQILDGSGPVYLGLADSLHALSGILESLDKVAAFIPRELPQLAGLITDLRVTLRTAEDVLVALTNNPLLRKGIPDRLEVQSSGTSPRDIQF